MFVNKMNKKADVGRTIVILIVTLIFIFAIIYIVRHILTSLLK